LLGAVRLRRQSAAGAHLLKRCDFGEAAGVFLGAARAPCNDQFPRKRVGRDDFLRRDATGHITAVISKEPRAGDDGADVAPRLVDQRSLGAFANPRQLSAVAAAVIERLADGR